MLRRPCHRRFGVAPAGLTHQPVELRDHLRATGGVVDDDEPRRRACKQPVASDHQRFDVLSLVDANHDDAAIVADLLNAAGNGRAERFGGGHSGRVEIIGGDRYALGHEVLDQPASHSTEADEANAFECRHLRPSDLGWRSRAGFLAFAWRFCCTAFFSARLPRAQAV